MNKKLVVIVFGVIILFATAVLVVVGDNATAPSISKNNQSGEGASQSNSNPGNEQIASAPVGQYVAYDSATVQSDKGEKILFFHAQWCPQCRQLDKEINANNIPSGTTIYKVDYDSNQTLRKKYGVTLQTTFVKIDEQGKLIKKYVAYDDPTFESLQDNIL